MKYYVETSLENFEAWSGGRDTLEVLIEKGLCDTVEACLEEDLNSYGEMPDDTAINDFLWFERDVIANYCGFSSWEALENGEEEDEEEEEEEPEENNFSRWCGNQSRDCSGCPYQKLHGMGDCETAYYHDNPDDDDGIRIYQ